MSSKRQYTALGVLYVAVSNLVPGTIYPCRAFAVPLQLNSGVVYVLWPLLVSSTSSVFITLITLTFDVHYVSQ